MNVCAIQDELINKPENITIVLEKLGHENIRDRGSYYQARNIGGDNNSGCSIRKDNLVWSNFSHGKSGNIWTMIMDETNCSFPEALKKVSNWINFKDDEIVCHKPFHGFYSQFTKFNTEDIIEIPTYKEDLLPDPNSLSYNFVKDGIAATTQFEWGLRYDHISNGTIIPWKNSIGELVGAKWRNNEPYCDFDKRWGMYLKFPMSQVVYGWYEHYLKILNKKICFIFESEKSVLQGECFNLNIGLAIGGHHISKAQELYIKNLYPNKIIVAFDSGITEDEIRFNAEKLLYHNSLHKIKVGYIYDKNNYWLKEKMSPTDLGRNTFEEVCKHCITYIN